MWTSDVLMCQPSFFNVNYKINPWMSGPPLQEEDKEEVQEQWLHLHHTIIRSGGYVKYMEPVPGLPDIVFTANGGLVHDKKVVLSRFADKERMPEEKHFHRWFKEAGYEVLTLQRPGDRFEGNGDSFIYNGTLYLGIGSRTSSDVAGRILDFFGLKKLILCELADPRFYHLDTCFCPLNDKSNEIMWYPGAFSEDSRKAISSEKTLLFEVSEEEALKFACNSVVFGHTVIMPSECHATAKKLQSRSYTVHLTEVDQFMKAGGAAKCLTLKV